MGEVGTLFYERKLFNAHYNRRLKEFTKNLRQFKF